MNDLNSEIIKILLAQKLQFLQKFFDTGMLWWVSAVVFCGVLLGIFWRYRYDLSDVKSSTFDFFYLCSALITLFLGSIVFYGFFMSWRVYLLNKEFESLIASINKSFVMNSEFFTMIYAYWLGTSSFVIIFVAWLGLLRHIAKLRKRKINDSPDPHSFCPCSRPTRRRRLSRFKTAGRRRTFTRY